MIEFDDNYVDNLPYVWFFHINGMIEYRNGMIDFD